VQRGKLDFCPLRLMSTGKGIKSNVLSYETSVRVDAELLWYPTLCHLQRSDNPWCDIDGLLYYDNFSCLHKLGWCRVGADAHPGYRQVYKRSES